MSLQQQVMDQMKVAMKAKNALALRALRAVKAAFLLASTETGAAEELSEAQAMKIIQKQVKQRKDSAAIFLAQDRKDLADPELEEIAILEQFLPAALSEAALEAIVVASIAKVGAVGMKDMGKVMGMVSKEVAGQADGKLISLLVKKHLMP